MGPGAVDDLGEAEDFLAVLLPLLFEPGEGGAEEAEGLAGAGGRFEERVLAPVEGLEDLGHEVELAGVGVLMGEVDLAVGDLEGLLVGKLRPGLHCVSN